MVKLWGKRPEPQVKDIPTRIKNMDDRELRMWLNNCIMELGSAYDKWSYRGGDSVEVSEILSLVDTLWTEVRNRSER